MPSAGTLAVFLLVATGVIVVPGPSNLYVLGRGLQSGHRAAVAGACGCATAALIYVVATAVGLSALIASSETLFAAIHYAGATYLCAIGVIALRRGHDGPAPAAPAAPVSIWPAYRQGVLVELGNPKVALFFLALFPQFIHDGAGPAWLQVLILGGLFAAIGLASDSAYAMGSGRLRTRLLARGRPRLPWQRLTGLLYIGLGLWAAFGGGDRRASAMSR
jgi:threonine/homoserine/homoserine lactone efflux protein